MRKKIAAGNIRLKRAYSSAGSSDGTRILVDRLWPRGVRKSDAAIDLWAKDLAPSNALRRWFGHDPARWTEFRRRYSEEIHQRRERLGELRALAQGGRITLVFAATMRLTTMRSLSGKSCWAGASHEALVLPHLGAITAPERRYVGQISLIRTHLYVPAGAVCRWERCRPRSHSWRDQARSRLVTFVNW